MDRGERRERSRRYYLRTWRVHIQVVHGSDGVWAPVGVSGWRIPCGACEKGPHFFVKWKAVGCNCRRRWRGNPKVPHSLCHRGEHQHPSVVERIRGKRLCREWLVRVCIQEPDDVEL